MDQNTRIRNVKGSAYRRKRKKTSRFPFFAIFIILLCAVAVIAVSSLLKKVTAFLEEYESVQPKYVGEQVYNRYFREERYGDLLEIYRKSREDGKIPISEFETEQDVINYLKTLCSSDDMSYVEVSASAASSSVYKLSLKNITGYFVNVFNDMGDVRYVVQSKGGKFAEFVISHSKDPGMVTPSGYVKYDPEPSSISLYFYPHESVTLKIPETSVITINGKTVSQEYLTDYREETESVKHMTDGAKGLVYVAYSVKDLYNEPRIEVKDKDGNAMQPVFNEEGNYYFCEARWSEELEKQYGQYVLTAMERYAAYIQDDGYSKDFRDYFDTDSQLWRNIMDNPWAFVMEHTSYGFEKEKAGEFYAYSDNVFSCRVSFEHHLKNPGAEDYIDYLDLTIYLHKGSDGIFRIYDTFAHK